MLEQLKLDNQLCFRLYTVSRLITQAYRPLLEPLGLTYPQYLVLMVLWERDNQLVSDITHRLMLDTNTVTPLLQRMEREGLLVRTRGIADGRQTLVSLTHKGKHLEEKAKDVPSCMADNLRCGSSDVERYASLVTSLDEMIETIKVKEK
ncbi:MAG: MarR family transcriptional regulator [Bacteroidales bacterium]|nr:MarR family transcriptional regulator [Bacteroidales bacterium]